MKILNCISFTEEQKKLLESVPGTEYNYCTKDTVTKELLADAEVIFGNVPVPMLQYTTNLKWLQLNSAGANQYCPVGVLPEDVLLTNAAGAYGASVSEHMLAVTMAMIKKLYLYQDHQKEHAWKDEGHVLSTEQMTVLVLGMGDIGCAYARKMKALGAYVIGVRRSALACPEGFDEVALIENLDQVLPRADVTAIVLPGTTETAGMFDERRLHLMKKGSYLLNVGRGNIIHTSDLEAVMKEGYLGGVSLDVTDPEPLPADHSIWDAPNVWITPHIAGGFHIDATLENIAAICKENLERYLSGQELTHQVNRKNQY